MQYTSITKVDPQGATPAVEGSEELLGALALVEGVGLEVSPEVTRVSPVTEKEVRSIIKARRSRSKFLPDELFADPAWDILLALYAAKIGQRKLSVTSACAAAGVPQTTALRWLTSLENKGFVIRSADPLDGRRFFVELSSSSKSSLDAYFLSRGGAVAIVY